MSHLFRFLAVAPAGEGSATWQIEGDELLHLRKVLRLAVGAPVEVTNGAGLWGRGTLVGLDPQIGLVECKEVHKDEMPRIRVSLAFGALKPGSVDEILPGLTELGIGTIHVFGQQETAKARLSEKAVERWQRIVLQAIKQCKRASMPNVVTHRDIAALLQATEGKISGRFLLAEAAQLTLLEAAEAALKQIGPGPQEVLVVLGGEIGLNAKEEAALEAAGFIKASLGPFVLRAVTAAVAAAAVLAVLNQKLGRSVAPRNLVKPLKS